MTFSKIKTLVFLSCLIGLISAHDLVAQFGYGNPMGRRAGFGRQQSIIPQSQSTPEETTPPTADELVDQQMPIITEALELDPFEEAVVRTTLVKSVQQRIELEILALDPLKMKEEVEKIKKRQDEEIKAGLPPDKFDAYLELQENKFKAKKKKKKKNKKKEKS
ncbi:hypothetical protein GTQ34_04265 [Muricauda sp. JGD-17]|uniref:Uncharacterized protein n=1 Tax=Flagellimonas ochracea TaxID=2696472 RepID=A0A964TCS9_9FLAO|nr:hypothetical protein [Allomuricauda ochracea]NAY91126.1 hypothetical protein [Allomuricauda ochracea]